MTRGEASQEHLGGLFRDIMAQEDVRGVMLFSFGGDLIHKEFLNPQKNEPETRDWWPYFFDSLNGVREADLVFEQGRLYIRRTERGYLLVLMGLFAPVPMVRLKCDILLPRLNGTGERGRRRGFFRKKK
jgi:hypothetical protein